MPDKPIDALVTSDIDTLVENSVAEDRTLEYKAKLPGLTAKDHKEFLADVASFANALGGYIIFGISEKPTDKGMPDEVVGVSDNLESEILRLDSMIRGGIKPRVPGVRFRRLPAGPSREVLVCWIPKSWQSPHMVTFEGASRFYARGASGKYELAVEQIREAFVGTEGLRERVRGFRMDRLAKIAGGEASPTPSFHRPAVVVLHIIPVSTFDTAGPAQDALDLAEARPRAWESTAHDFRYNFDGVLGYVTIGGKCSEYVQVFRNGTIEAVDARTLHEDQRIIQGSNFEQMTIRAVARYLSGLTGWGIGGPFLIMLSLVNVRGYMVTTRESLRPTASAIDRDMVVVPELWMEESPPKELLPDLLRQTLDIVWQSSGWPSSRNYQSSGEYETESDVLFRGL